MLKNSTRLLVCAFSKYFFQAYIIFNPTKLQRTYDILTKIKDRLTFHHFYGTDT